MTCNVVKGSGGLFFVETLADGSVGRLRYAKDTQVESRFAITDGLIVAHPSLGAEQVEWRCSARHCESEGVIDFVIVAGKELEQALEAMALSSVLQALQWSQWVFETPWIEQEEF